MAGLGVILDLFYDAGYVHLHILLCVAGLSGTCLVWRAGYVMVSIFNVLFILVLGMSDGEGTKITVPQQQSAYPSSPPPPMTQPTYPSRG